ncbi:MAG TPA: hypothetical protein PLB38_03485 [bacterium]|nr:hypothetical protein [bacterium]
MSGAAATIMPIDDFVDYGEDGNIPIYQLARQWQDDDLQALVHSPLTAIFSLKLHFEQVLSDDWQRRAGDFLLAELPFYLRLSDFRPENEQWSELLNALPRGSEALWQGWLRRQMMVLLEIDEELLKAVYYHFSLFRKKGCLLNSGDLLNAYRDLSRNGRFNLSDFNKVAEYFAKNQQKQGVACN